MADIINTILTGDLELVQQFILEKNLDRLDWSCLTFSAAFGQFHLYRFFVDNCNIPLTTSTIEYILWNLAFGVRTTNREHHMHTRTYQYYKYLRLPNDAASRQWWCAHLTYLIDNYGVKLPLYLSEYLTNKIHMENEL